MTAAVVLVLLAVLLALVVLRSRTTVPPEHAGVVERLGRYSRTLEPGTHQLAPYADAVRCLVGLGRREPRFVVTVVSADGFPVEVTVELGFRVVDPVAATYEITDLERGLEQLTTTTLRHVAGDVAVDDMPRESHATADTVRTTLREVTGAWGVQLDWVRILEMSRA